MKIQVLSVEFCDLVPSGIENGVLYISIKYGCIVHLCCCGCEEKVVTPLTPTDWEFSYNGETVSLNPSIGNWSFKCKSHYWIIDNKVKWARHWTTSKIEAARMMDYKAKAKFFKEKSDK